MSPVHLPIELSEPQAAQVAGWLEHGRVRYWENADLRVAGGFHLAPTHHDNGDEAMIHKPHWQCHDLPSLEIFSTDAFAVVTRVEVKRFRVGLRMGSQGFTVKLTDGASNRLRRELAKAGEGATYHFDYGTQEAVITVRETTMPMSSWLLLRKELQSGTSTEVQSR